MSAGFGDLVFSALRRIYTRTCRKCHHRAVRKDHHGTWVCDWCRIEASQRLWRIGGDGRLYVDFAEARRRRQWKAGR